LEADGLVERAADAEDRRVVRVRATPRGAKLLQEGRQRRVASLAAALRELPSAERSAIARAIPAMEKVVRGA
jgi:DNA-binding MarR family transcriptional regulator